MLPFTDVVSRLLGKHSLLEHIVERVDGAQLQPLLLVKHLGLAHTTAFKHTHERQQDQPALYSLMLAS